MVKELRDKTGAGMMDCKKALAETGGDLEKAVDELRKRGQAIANKRGGRAMKEGLIVAKTAGSVGALIELNAETDFVTRNEEFRALAQALADAVFAAGPALPAGDMEHATQLPLAQYGGKTVAETITALIGKIGENMAFSRFIRYEAKNDAGAGSITAYIHPPGKLGVMLELEAGKAETLGREAFVTLARDLAMHVAAAAPVSLNREDVPAALVARERAIYADSDELKSKPEAIRERIIDGKMGKFFKQSVLLEQEFVKDPDQSIAKLVESVGKQLGDTIKVARFARFVVGQTSEAEGEAAE